MYAKLKSRLMTLAFAMSLTLTFQATTTFAQEQTPSESAATTIVSPTPTPTPSDTEIKKTLVRSLDKNESQQKVIEGQDEVISEQDRALDKSEKAAANFRQSAEMYRDAFLKQRSTTESAEVGWKQSEKRVRDLERKLHNSNTRTKFAIVTGIAAAVTLFFLK
jgi:hypothetical protein